MFGKREKLIDWGIPSQDGTASPRASSPASNVHSLHASHKPAPASHIHEATTIDVIATETAAKSNWLGNLWKTAKTTSHKPPPAPQAVSDVPLDEVLPQETEPKIAQLPALSDLTSVVSSLHDLPPFTEVLTADSRDLFILPPSLRLHLCAVDCGRMSAVIIRTSEPPTAYIELLEQNYLLLRGKLTSEGYTLRPTRSCTPQLLAEICASADSEHRGESVADNQALIRFRRWVDTAIENGRGDLRIKALFNQGTVRQRVNGAMQPLRDGQGGKYTRKQVIDSLSQSYFQSAHGNSSGSYFETELLDTIIKHKHAGKNYSLRWSQIPSPYGAEVVIRIMDDDAATSQITSLDTFGLEPSQVETILAGTRRLKGIVLFTGPTGMGKSTLQRVVIEAMENLDELAVVSLENPVETPIRGTHQASLTETGDQEKDKLKWQKFLHHCLRHDPDIIVVQELTNPLTMHTAVTAAMTAHLVFGTSHVNGIANIMNRISSESQQDFGRERLTSPGILNTFVFVYLLPRLCPHCKIAHSEYAFDHAEQQAQVSKLLNGKLTEQDQRDNFFWRNHQGCAHCDKGLQGRIPVAEVYSPDLHWLKLSRDGLDIEAEEYRCAASDKNPFSNNMNGKTAFDHALLRALRGEIDPRMIEQLMVTT